ncbi:MAG: F0F1 ATP synthase subunit epsilon [bacterium]|nr:F0F1 ATP synthase subunit epsilon [bacterium]
MLLKILSLNKIEYEDEVAGLNVKTSSGEITVLNGHRPLVSVLVSGTAQIMTKDNKKIPFNIRSGFLEMDDKNRLNLLVDQL